MQRGARRDGRPEKYQNPVAVGVVLLIAGISVAMIQYKVPTILTDLMSMFSMGGEQASWLMSVFTLMSIFVALPAGLLAQRFGAKTMMIVSLGLAVAGSLVGFAANASVVLIVSRAIEGVALTVLTTCGPIAVQASVSPEKVGTAMGIWGIWGCLGSTIAAVVTPTVFESMGFGGVWVVFAAFAVVAAALVLFALRMPAGGAGGCIDAAGCGSGSTESPGSRKLDAAGISRRARYREVFTRDTALFFIGFAAFNICLLAILAFVPTILQRQGFDATLSGFISTAPMLLSIVSSPLFGAISDRVKRCKPLLVTAMLVMGPCTFLLYTETGVLMWCAVVVMGLVGMGGVGLFLSGYVRLLPRTELVSIGMGVLVLVQGVGQFLGTFLVQMLLGPHLANFTFAGAVLMAIGFAGAVSLALCRMR